MNQDATMQRFENIVVAVLASICMIGVLVYLSVLGDGWPVAMFFVLGGLASLGAMHFLVWGKAFKRKPGKRSVSLPQSLRERMRNPFLTDPSDISQQDRFWLN